MEDNSSVQVIDLDLVDVYVINGNFNQNPKELCSIHKKSFKCWHEVWEDFYKSDHGISHRLSSDEFTRQDNILSIFYKGECFGITFFKEVNWDDPTAPLDSYFGPWPKEALNALVSRGKKVLICSQFTIAKNFRGKATDIQWKNLLTIFIAKHFLESEADVMTGTMRIKKGMEKISYDNGGIPIYKNLAYKDLDETVDLVGFYKKEVILKYKDNPHAKKLDKCWERLNGKLHSQLKLVG